MLVIGAIVRFLSFFLSVVVVVVVMRDTVAVVGSVWLRRPSAE